MINSAGLESRSRTRPWLIFRILLSGGVMMLAVCGSLILIALAALLPQIPRQRAITLVESRGGSLSFNNTYPEWVYEAFGPERVQRMESVSEINLDGADVDDAVIARLIELREAKVVWLNSGQMTDRGARLLTNFESITSLDLGSTNLTERSLVPILEQHTSLETVWLQHTAAGDEALRALADTTTLRNLRIYNTNVTDAGLAHLSRLSRLYDLDLDNTAVGDEGLAHLAGCHSLSDLSLANTQVSGPGLEPLAHLPSLQHLNLSGTRVDDEGARHLSASTSLTTLNLDGTLVTDDGLEHLAKITTLSSLSLHGVEITDRGLRHLQDATHLSELYIDTHLLTPDAVAELRAALPNCSINGAEEVMWSTYSGGGFF